MSRDICVFTMYNKSQGERVIIYLKKNLITHVVEYPEYYTVHYTTGTTYDGSYKVVKDFSIEDIFEDGK